MPDDPSDWDRIAALIEECRAEREACACARERIEGSDPSDRSLPDTIRRRLMAGVGETATLGR